MKDYTNTSKKNIISALRDKGVDVNNDVEWYELDDKIEQIEIATGTHSDWNQNDSTAADYIENRPFYTGDPVETVFVEERTVSFTNNDGIYMAEFPSTFTATVGEVYKVSWDGTVYECTCVEFSGETVIGNLSIAGEGSDTGEPFLIVMDDAGIQIVTADTSASHTISISGFVPGEVVKIDKKYLPTTVGFITYTDNGTYSSDLTYDELYKILLDGGQVILSVPAVNKYCYLTKWIKVAKSGRIDLVLGGEENGYDVSLFPDGTIDRTPLE